MQPHRSIVLHLHGDSFARRYQVASHAITAAASGAEVLVILWFEGLTRWVNGSFDEPVGADDGAVAERLGVLGLPPPSVMLAEARALGARIAACETAVRLAGLDPDELGAEVDERPGLQEILERELRADLVLYV
ncbi:hypothetical protein [Vulgatibacter incomptus]|nr:hypothetical protein [Vulgatibacter incomptus]